MTVNINHRIKVKSDKIVVEFGTWVDVITMWGMS